VVPRLSVVNSAPTASLASTPQLTRQPPSSFVAPSVVHASSPRERAGYGWAVGVVAATAVLHAVLVRGLGAAPGCALFLPAVAIVAVRFSTAAGLVTAALSLALAELAPWPALAGPRGGVARLLDGGLFAVCSLLMIALAQQLRGARSRGHADRQLAEDAQRLSRASQSTLDLATEEYRGLLLEARQSRDRAERAARLEHAILEFFGHDLRSPLVSVVGFSDLLAQHPEETQTRDRAVQTIARNARRLKEILDELMDASSVLAGRVRLELTTVDLSAEIESAVALASSAARIKDVKLDLAPAGRALPVHADPRRLRQILRYLLSNATEASPIGEAVGVAIRERDGQVEVEATDRGDGFDAQAVQPLLDGVGRKDPAHARAAGRSGLELALLTALVELHGGSFRAERAAPDGGATLTITLPAESSEPTHSQTQKPDPAQDETR